MKPAPVVSPPLDYRTTNSLWSSIAVETLYQLGLRYAVISPGSRSTPLTLAFARHPGINSISVLDERSASFFALGLAKREGNPVVLLCTSGTAGANYFAAIIEARESGVPLLVITADRPPEMRECHSGQTIDQQKLFGSHVNFYHELAVPGTSRGLLNYLRQTMMHAWEQSQWPEAGPVHLNAPFRDPLSPVENDATVALAKSFPEEKFFASLRRLPRVESSTPHGEWTESQRVVIVVGPAENKFSGSEIGALEKLVRKLGAPVLADGLSGLRGKAAHFPTLITRYDTILRRDKTGEALRPEVVICLGGWPISKPLRAWLEKHQPTVWMVTTRRQNLDALHLATRHIRCDLKSFADHLSRLESEPSDYAKSWVRAEEIARAGIDGALMRARRFEGKIVFNLARYLPRFTPVFVANSMPARDVEYFWPANDRAHVLYFSRGANGIDGTLSTALGVAHEGRPAILLTGDLALLHDTNGFLIGPKFKGSLTIVLINNNGGGIFEHLPIAQFNPPFEEFFATPQKIDFAKLSSAYGVSHQLLRSEKQLMVAISQLPRRGIRVLEFRTDRKKDAALRKAIFATAALAVEAKLGGR